MCRSRGPLWQHGLLEWTLVLNKDRIRILEWKSGPHPLDRKTQKLS